MASLFLSSFTIRWFNIDSSTRIRKNKGFIETPTAVPCVVLATPLGDFQLTKSNILVRGVRSHIVTARFNLDIS